MRVPIKTKAFRILTIVAVLAALYALAGFVLAPKILRSALLKDIPEVLGVTPAVGDIRINPFLFRLEIDDFSLTAADGEKLAGFRRLWVDFELSSIWRGAYSFSRIELDAPTVNAVIAKDGRLNLLQLSPKRVAAQPQASHASLPGIRIGSFKVADGRIAYEDHSRPTEFSARLEPIQFELVSFTTAADGGRFTFSGSSKLGERVEWHGHVSVQPIASDGEFKIEGLRAHTIWEYLEDRLNFSVASGTVDLDATYRFSLRDTVDLNAVISSIAVRDLTVRPKDSPDDWVTVPALIVNGATVDLAGRQAHADSVRLTGLKLVTWLDPGGSMNLLTFARTPDPPPPASPAAAAPAAPAAAVPAAAPWKFDLHEFELREGSISAEDRSTSPAAKVLLSSISLKAAGASLDLAKPVTVSLDSRIDDSGSIGVTGDVTPQPLSANLAVKLAGLELKAFQPYVAQRTSMTLVAGRVSGEAKVHYGAGKPALTIGARVGVDGLHTVDNALHDDFVNWDRLDVTGISFQHDPDRLDIDQVAARKLYARLIIEPDETLNVKRVLAGPGATVIAPAGPGGTPVASTAPPAAAPKSSTAQPAVPGMPMSIKKITLQGSSANFTDLSVQPNFSTGVQRIEGSVLGLSSKENSRAKVDIHGAVDTFSPVSISGEVNVLSGSLYTDLAMSFRNMELSTFNPYSGKFAGYNITKGKLTTLLHYKVEGRKLDAQHHITVEQLEFGDKTESKEAVSLPVKLAVALLKDRNGIIDIDIPVTGTLDDPAFKLAPIIWKVFVGILEKAVTAPFALLGAFFGSGPELQFIDFAPGAAVLDAAAGEKLRTLVKALDDRPQLKLEVPIAAVAELDRPALIEAKFAAAAPGMDAMDPAAQVGILTQLYAKNIGGAPKFPDSVTSIKGKAELAAAKSDFLSKALHQRIVITDSDLTALGQQRAAAVQQAMLADSKLDPARVFLVANDKAKNEDGEVRLELSLK